MYPNKKVFTTIEEAMNAVARDRYGTVYVKAKEVFIATTYGSGKFSKEEYDRFMGKEVK